MKIRWWTVAFVVLLATSCTVLKKKERTSSFQYDKFKAMVLYNDALAETDSANVLDSVFIPGQNTLQQLLKKMDTVWSHELSGLQNERPAKGLYSKEKAEEIKILTSNLKSLNYYLKNSSKLKKGCKQMECAVMAEVLKEKQIMYLYVNGWLVDSFAVSTGVKGRETPDMDQHPTGPLFIKYNSKKFPGGNYMGLGNMPYAVFIKGGYAIHGTTQGNFKKLGTKASHGCIRLHPNNAKLFNELVAMAGLNNTWVIVR